MNADTRESSMHALRSTARKLVRAIAIERMAYTDLQTAHDDRSKRSLIGTYERARQMTDKLRFALYELLDKEDELEYF